MVYIETKMFRQGCCYCCFVVTIRKENNSIIHLKPQFLHNLMSLFTIKMLLRVDKDEIQNGRLAARNYKMEE